LAQFSELMPGGLAARTASQFEESFAELTEATTSVSTTR
jgi:hypothetical protein